MIDLHCHMLPGIDDGSPDEATSLAMARMAVQDGIRTTACTPHIYPGLYENEASDIRVRVAALQARLDAEGIALRLTVGADAHLTPELLSRLHGATAPTLHGGRYFLLEPPHHVAPPRFEESVFSFLAEGYVPVITHPERLTWFADHYAVFKRLALNGAWMQVTAGSLTGRFGSGPKVSGKRLLEAGLVHILATDSHDLRERAPRLAEGRDAAARLVGRDEAHRLVNERPQAILDNTLPAHVTPIPALARSADATDDETAGFWQRLWGRRRHS